MLPWEKTWNSIKTRCDYPSSKSYKHYGGRGIKLQITKEELKTLYERDNAKSMKRPSIGRIDHDGHYTFKNCLYQELSENIKQSARKDGEPCPIGHEDDFYVFVKKDKNGKVYSCRLCRKCTKLLREARKRKFANHRHTYDRIHSNGRGGFRRACICGKAKYK